MTFVKRLSYSFYEAQEQVVADYRAKGKSEADVTPLSQDKMNTIRPSLCPRQPVGIS